MNTPFRAVIWDFGGVITSSPFDAFNRHEAERGLPHNAIRGINARDPDSNAWARLERDELDAAGFDAAFAAEAEALGLSIRGARGAGAAVGGHSAAHGGGARYAEGQWLMRWGASPTMPGWAKGRG